MEEPVAEHRTGSQHDTGTVASTGERAGIKVYTQEEVDALIAEAKESKPNPAPAHEEGPHLDDSELRELKRSAMLDHGWTGDEDHLTADMRAILAEDVATKGDD